MKTNCLVTPEKNKQKYHPENLTKGINSIHETHTEAYSLNGVRRGSKHKFIPNDLSKFKGHSHKLKKRKIKQWAGAK